MIAETDVLIIGGGIAGCVAALELAKQGIRVTVISAGSANSFRAQGGIAYRAPNEPSHLFKEDILKDSLHMVQKQYETPLPIQDIRAGTQSFGYRNKMEFTF